MQTPEEGHYKKRPPQKTVPPEAHLEKRGGTSPWKWELLHKEAGRKETRIKPIEWMDSRILGRVTSYGGGGCQALGGEASADEK